MQRAKRTITYSLPIRNLPETAPFTALRQRARRRQCQHDVFRGLIWGCLLGGACYGLLWFGVHALVDWLFQ